MIKIKRAHRKYRIDYPSDFVFDYKDPYVLGRFITEGGKVVPSRISKLSHFQQRKVAKEIKKARHVALLPNGAGAYDSFEKVEMVSPVPFEF